MQEWQCPDTSTKRRCGFQRPATDIGVDEQCDDNDQQETADVAKQLGDRQQNNGAAQRNQQGGDAVVALVDRADVEQRT